MSARDEELLACRRPVVAVSRCLLGEDVRYDGGNCRVSWIVEMLSEHCDILGICPEVAAELGIPRPPVRLCVSAGELFLLGRDDPRLDVTAELLSASYRLLEDLHAVDGLILKSKSPSCGLSDTPIFDLSNLPVEAESGAGVFARLVTQQLPSVPAVDESALKSEAGRVSFLVGVFRHCCRRLAQPLT